MSVERPRTKLFRRGDVFRFGALSLFLLGGAIVVSSALLIWLPPLEAAFLPVVADVRFSVVRRNGARMTLDWSGDKRRACEIVTAVARVRRDGEWIGAYLSAADDSGDEPLPFATHPVGPQRFRRMDVIPSGDAIAVDLRHHCHSAWLSVTSIAATDLP